MVHLCIPTSRISLLPCYHRHPGTRQINTCTTTCSPQTSPGKVRTIYRKPAGRKRRHPVAAAVRHSCSRHSQSSDSVGHRAGSMWTCSSNPRALTWPIHRAAGCVNSTLILWTTAMGGSMTTKYEKRTAWTIVRYNVNNTMESFYLEFPLRLSMRFHIVFPPQLFGLLVLPILSKDVARLANRQRAAAPAR